MWLTMRLRPIGFRGSGAQVQGLRVPDPRFSGSRVGRLTALPGFRP